MNTYVAFLRGINVGGHKKFSMSDQERLFIELGLKNVQAYLQTGNIVFQTPKIAKEVTSEIYNAISKKYGWEVPVLIKSPSEIAAIVKHCPFPKEQKEKSYIILLHNVPEQIKIESVTSLTSPDETFVLREDYIYLHSDNGYGRAKFNNNYFERILEVTATTRNYKTMAKMLHLAYNLTS